MLQKKHPIANLPQYFLIGSVLLLLVFFFLFASPFLATLFAAAVTATVVYPLDKIIREKVTFSRSFSALLTFLVIVILFLIPLSFFTISIIGQAYGAYDNLSDKINELMNTQYDFLPMLDQYPWLSQILEKNPISVENVASIVSEIIRSISTFLLEHTAKIIRQVAMLVLHSVIFLLGLYYFIRDGEKLTAYIKNTMPLEKDYKTELFKRIENTMNSIVFGMFGATLAQGIVLGIGLAVVGIPNVIFWAGLGAILSVIPYIGSAIIWIPIVIYYFLSGEIFSAVFLLIWGSIFVANIDNIIKPYLIGSKATLHPLAVMVMILGGAIMFGFKGLVLGPLVLTLTLSFLHIYKQDYKSVLEKK